jgi:hypothetical protein
MMFERLLDRARQIAAARASLRRSAIAEEIAAAFPEDVAVAVDDAGVTVGGRGLRRRFALDTRLRALRRRIP